MTRRAPLFINCPECHSSFDWTISRTCASGHSVRSIGNLPLCFTEAQYRTKKTADPLYPMEHAVAVAARLTNQASSYRHAVDLFFDIRENELKMNLDRERELVTRRSVAAVNECIADASLLLSAIGRPFPQASRYHLDIGCGMGFGLAASAKSYFGSNVIGIDLSPHYLAMAQLQLREHGLPDVPLLCADICDGWPIPLDKYDVAFISMEGVLEHIKNLPGFFRTIQTMGKFPLVIYLTVPYRWTMQRESHFNMRWISWLPRAYQDRVIAHRLGVKAIDHVEFYSRSSLRRLLENYFTPQSISIALNSNNPLHAHYLRCLIYVEGPGSFVPPRPGP